MFACNEFDDCLVGETNLWIERTHPTNWTGRRLATPFLPGDGSAWSVMGSPGGLYSHPAYHLGNLDIYLRQADSPARDFY